MPAFEGALIYQNFSNLVTSVIKTIAPPTITSAGN